MNNLPIPLAPNHATWRLKQTVRTIPAYNLLRYTSGTLDLMTVLTV